MRASYTASCDWTSRLPARHRHGAPGKNLGKRALLVVHTVKSDDQQRG